MWWWWILISYSSSKSGISRGLFVVDTDDPVNIELSGRAAAGGCGCGCVAVAVVATGLYGNSGVGDLILSESVCSSIIDL